MDIQIHGIRYSSDLVLVRDMIRQEHIQDGSRVYFQQKRVLVVNDDEVSWDCRIRDEYGIRHISSVRMVVTPEKYCHGSN